MARVANIFDVVIAGGGPAGSAAAFTLAAAGFRVAVVDKHIFPRDKLCGGLLTLRAKKIFRQVFQSDWSPAVQHTARGVKFYFGNTLLNPVADYRDISFCCRREFDAFLLKLAVQRGAVLLEGHAVKSIDLVKGAVALSDDRTLGYDFLIGADGVNSVVARNLFGAPFDPGTIGFGLELEVPIGGAVPRIVDPEIYFGVIDWGYGWVFPKRDTLTAGVGGSLRKNPDLMSSFKRFSPAEVWRNSNGKNQGASYSVWRFPPRSGPGQRAVVRRRCRVG